MAAQRDRRMSLHDVVGHEEARRTLARARVAGTLPASLLFHGMRGSGKQRMALWTAQLRVCEAPSVDGPCGTCRPCRLARDVEHPDLHLYMPLPRPKGVSGDRLGDALEAARGEALEELRREPLRSSHDDEVRGLYLETVQSLRRKAHVRPTMAPAQIFIVTDAELLVPQESSPEAANALLKLLEEPPADTHLILTSSEPGRLLPTIRSRTVPVHLAPLSTDEVAAFLERIAEVPRDEARRVAALAQGSIGRALGFLPDGDAPGPLEALRLQALALTEAALRDGGARGFSAALDYRPSGARGMVDLFAFLEETLRDLAAVAAGAEDRVLGPDVLPRLRTILRQSEVEAGSIPSTFPVVEEAREMARGNVNPQLIVFDLVRRLHRSLHPDGAAEVRT